METELRIDGANCPTCLNATIDALRATPGVHRVAAASADGCLAIVHDDLDVGSLVDTIRAHLHGQGVGTSSAEIVIVSVEPLVAELRCDHH